MGLPGFTNTKQGLMCLAHGNSAVPPVGLEPARQRCYEELFPKANVMLSMCAVGVPIVFSYGVTNCQNCLYL